MANCDINALLTANPCFAELSERAQQAVIAALLCNISSGGGGGSGVPSGVILMWSGTIATIPTGWQLCNGTNGTPDLRNKFVVCADADSGGAAKSTITGVALQSGGANTHTHTFAGNTGATQTSLASSSPGGLDVPGAADNTLIATYAIDTTPTPGGGAAAHLHTFAGTTASGTAIPTFFALAYIQKL
jgi:hypothetical protein